LLKQSLFGELQCWDAQNGSVTYVSKYGCLDDFRCIYCKYILWTSNKKRLSNLDDPLNI
jgi:hypothetical protein